MLAILIQQLTLKKIKLSKQIIVGILLILIVSLSIRTFVRISDWQDNLSLFDPKGKQSNDFISENSYAAALINDGQFEKAKPYVLESIKEHPFSVNLNNLAIIFAAKGDKINADLFFQKAITIGQNLMVYENYANYLLYYETPEKTLNFSQKAIKIFPQSAGLNIVLAQAYYLQNNKTDALKYAGKAYEIAPDQNIEEIIIAIKNNKPLPLRHK